MRKVKLRGKSSFGSRLLRALKMVSGFELPLPHREKHQTDVPIGYLHYNFQGDLRAMLEAERRKAEATMNYRRRNLPC